MNEGTFDVHYFDTMNETHQSYYLIDENLQSVTIKPYNPSESTFLNFTQNFLHNNITYHNVLVFKSWNTEENNYLIIEPNFNLLLLEQGNDVHQLIE